MPTAVGTQFQTSPAQAQLRDQLLTVFRDSRQLKENSAQLRQRLVTAVFATAQGQIDQARSERFAESEASKGRKGQRQAIGLSAAIPAVGGAVTGGIAGGIAGGAEGATLGALAGASAGFGLPVARGVGAPASQLFGQFIGQKNVVSEAGGGGVTQKAITPPVVAVPGTGTQLATPTFLEDFVPAADKALTPSRGVEKATAAVAAIAGLSDGELGFAAGKALDSGDQEAINALAREVLRRGLGQ